MSNFKSILIYSEFRIISLDNKVMKDMLQQNNEKLQTEIKKKQFKEFSEWIDFGVISPRNNKIKKVVPEKASLKIFKETNQYQKHKKTIFSPEVKSTKLCSFRYACKCT